MAKIKLDVGKGSSDQAKTLLGVLLLGLGGMKPRTRVAR